MAGDGRVTMTTGATLRAAAAALLLCLGMAGAAAAADSHCPQGLPPGIVCGAPDYRLAPAGHYAVDASHASIVARVSHIGYSYSIFRFGDVIADLTWDPAHPEASTLKASVKTASIATPVPNFAAELAGPNFLSSTAFPDAAFTSTAFHQTSPAKGRVDGVFTLRGKSAPLSLDVELIGAGPGFGAPRMGAHASGWINPSDYGMPPMFAAPIELLLDVEFVKAPAAG
jgi:polyisoprenoid-binding protein YceI